MIIWLVFHQICFVTTCSTVYSLSMHAECIHGHMFIYTVPQISLVCETRKATVETISKQLEYMLLRAT